jgi:hypothetical protein
VEDRINAVWGIRANDPTPYEGTNRAKDGGSVEANAEIYQSQGPAPPKYAVTPKSFGSSLMPRAAATPLEPTPTKPAAVVLSPAERKKSSAGRIGVPAGILFGGFGILVFCVL